AAGEAAAQGAYDHRRGPHHTGPPGPAHPGAHTPADVAPPAAEVTHRPADLRGVQAQPRLGVDGTRRAHGAEQRDVVDRVAVGEAAGEVDPALAGQGQHPRLLALAVEHV